VGGQGRVRSRVWHRGPRSDRLRRPTVSSCPLYRTGDLDARIQLWRWLRGGGRGVGRRSIVGRDVGWVLVGWPGPHQRGTDGLARLSPALGACEVSDSALPKSVAHHQTIAGALLELRQVFSTASRIRSRVTGWGRTPQQRPVNAFALVRGVFRLVSDWHPRQDSNLRSRLRRAVLYPLSYGGSGRSRIVASRAVVQN
jgi:hypothetical protein